MTQLDLVALNHAQPPMDDLNFRMALNYAVDRETLISQVLFGYAEPGTSYQPKGVPMFDASVPGYPYDLEKAKDYLAKSKYADGAEFELMTYKGRDDQIAVATALQGMWEQLPGVKVNVVQYEPGVAREKRAAGEHQAYMGAYLCDTPDDDQIAIFWITGWGAKQHNADITEVQPLVLAAQSETDPVKRAEFTARSSGGRKIPL
jgi:peptide/nickel transport system substrate-binding protein